MIPEVEVPIDIQAQNLTLQELPKKWALQKPLAEYNVEMVDRLIAAGRIVASKKYNGHRVHVLINQDGEPLLYNRTNKDILNEYVPSLIDNIRQSNLPKNSLLDGEIYIPNNGKKESLDALQEVISCGSTALGAQRDKITPPNIAIFDTLIYNGENLILKPYKIRHAIPIPQARLHMAEIIKISSRQQGLQASNDAGWEGLVLWDLNGPHKLNLNGNTKRGPSYKLKPEFDEDFLAVGFKEGTGYGKGKVGTLLIGKYISGAFVEFGEVGSGLSELEKIEYTNPAKYPFVVAVKHFGLDNKGRVTLASIQKVHKDKRVDEV